MCGISGIINKNKTRVNKNDIQDINDLIAHRGPDDEGFYIEKNFAFGHRRLSILDLSSDGHQPMHYLDKYVITYNGEVYNYLGSLFHYLFIYLFYLAVDCYYYLLFLSLKY